MAEKDFTHINKDGKVQMVDVGQKSDTLRTATAKGFIDLPKPVLELVRNQDIQTKKGPVIQTAILAGIMAVKRTSELIPLCHPLPITKCDIDLQIRNQGIEITCEVTCTGKTGVEMEALTGVSIAALTVYDMCKAFGHEMEISGIRLISKTGGKSDYNGV